MRRPSMKPVELAPVSAAAHNHQQQYSTWHSPIPYLFGGLAAMLGLIAFALLILACSYWRISGGNGGDEEQNGESEKQRGPSESRMSKECDEKVLVIMPGDRTATYLATPAMTNGLGLFDGESPKPQYVGAGKLGSGEKVAENGEESEGSDAVNR